MGDDADVEEAWTWYVWLEATEWKFLPRAGGLEDQDMLLMENVFRIRTSANKLRPKPKPEA